MTLASEIVTRGYRETNLIPLGASPSDAQLAEGYYLLNGLILSALGYEAGDELREINYDGTYSQADVIGDWVPDNVRLIFNEATEVTISLDPYPYEGQRFAISDAGYNFTLYNLIVNGNGRNIEGFPEAVFIDDGMQREYLYRSDTSNWVAITNLGDDDDFPFPTEFEDLFVLMLAMRLNPRYGQELSADSGARLNNSRSKLRARYRKKTYDVETDPGLVDLGDYYGYGTTAFNRGGFGPWLT